MALINVTKKLQKAGDSIGLLPDEEVLAACTTNPAGTMKRMLARELRGALASAAAGKGQQATAVEGGLAQDFPSGQMFLGITTQRLTVTKVGVMTGNPKDLVAEYPHDRIAAIDVEKGRMAAPLTIVFSDGTANPTAVAEAFNQL
jgi:hypothetical protein